MARLLSLDDRLDIEKYLKAGLSIHKISRELGFADSTIRGEVRNNSSGGRYCGMSAHEISRNRRRLPKSTRRQNREPAKFSMVKRNMRVKTVQCSYCHGVGEKTVQNADNPRQPIYLKCIICGGSGEVAQ